MIAIKSNAIMIKADCPWSVVAYMVKKMLDKWKLLIHKHRYTHYGP